MPQEMDPKDLVSRDDPLPTCRSRGLIAVQEGRVGGGWRVRFGSHVSFVLLGVVLVSPTLYSLGQGQSGGVSLPTDDLARERVLQSSLEADPSNTTAARALAELLERRGEVRAAVHVRQTILANTKDARALTQARLELATALVEAGQEPEAVPLLKDVLAQDSANESADFELGTALARQQRFNDALPYFQAAVKLRPDDSDAQLSLAKVLITLLRYQEAEPCIEAAARSTRDSATVATLRGILYSQTGRAAQAIPFLQEAAVLQPQDAEAQLRYGESLRVAGRLDDAIGPLTTAATLQPSVSAWFQLAKIYRTQGKKEEEQRALEKLKAIEAERSTTTKVEVLQGAAKAHLAAGQREAAVAEYEEAINLEPENSDLLYSLALVRGQMHDTKQENALLTRALDARPRFADALAELGKLEVITGNTAEAKQHLQQALAVDPQNSVALTSLAVVTARDGDLHSAETLLRDAIGSDSHSAEAFRNLGLIEAALGKTGEADRALHASLSLNPADATTLVALGKLCLFERRSSEAISYLQQATHVAPLDPQGFESLAEALSLSGDFSGSLRANSRAITLAPESTQLLKQQETLCMSAKGVRLPPDVQPLCAAPGINARAKDRASRDH